MLEIWKKCSCSQNKNSNKLCNQKEKNSISTVKLYNAFHTVKQKQYRMLVHFNMFDWSRLSPFKMMAAWGIDRFEPALPGVGLVVWIASTQASSQRHIKSYVKAVLDAVHMEGEDSYLSPLLLSTLLLDLGLFSIRCYKSTKSQNILLTDEGVLLSLKEYRLEWPLVTHSFSKAGLYGTYFMNVIISCLFIYFSAKNPIYYPRRGPSLGLISQ